MTPGMLLFLFVEAFLFMLFVRTMLVERCRAELITAISVKANEDIDHGRAWRWRFAAYNRISFARMVLSYWIWPVSACYTDHRFYRADTEPGGELG